MPQSAIPRDFSYFDAIRVLSDSQVTEEIEGASRRLTHDMWQSVQDFESLSKQMHTIDLQRIATPFKQRWDNISKAYANLLPCYRANACHISGRLKLFCSSVLPVSRNVDGLSHRSQESMQMLQSFMSISSEHAGYTQSLLERSMTLVREMVSLHIELAQVACQQLSSGQKEVLELATKSSELEMQVRRLCSLNMAMEMPEPIYSVFTAFRLAIEFGRKPNNSRLTTQPLALPLTLQRISQAVEALDAKRNEYAHAQYLAQVNCPQNHYLARTQASLSMLIDKTLRRFETSLILFLSIWARIRSDCCSLSQWLNNPKSKSSSLVSHFQQTGESLYPPLTGILEGYISGINIPTPSLGG